MKVKRGGVIEKIMHAIDIKEKSTKEIFNELASRK